MSDDQKENPEKPRVRKIVRSASTAETKPDAVVADAPKPEASKPETPAAAPATAAPSGDAATDDAASQRKWDLRRERAPGAAPGAPPRGDRRPRRGPRPGGAPGDRPAGASPEGSDGAPRRFRREFPSPDGTPLRPVSGGRAMPEYRRGPLDRSSAEFVDKWLTTPQRKPEEGRPSRAPGERGPGAERGPRDRDRRDRRPEGDAGKPALAARPAAPPMKRREAPPPPAPKVPTLHETILVGLPKVSLEKQRAEAAKPKTAKEALIAKTAVAAPKPKTEPAKGEELVETAWIGVEAAKAIATLKAAGGAADALVDAWVKAKNYGAIVETGLTEDLSGAARKAARRALAALKAKGVELPKRLEAAPAPATTEEEVTEATFTAPDGRGTISITIAKRRGGERAHIAEIIVREGAGVAEVRSGWMSRSAIKEAHQRITEATGVAPAAVSPDWVRSVVEEALQNNAKSGLLVPIGLEQCKDLLVRDSAEAPKHPCADLEASLEGDLTAPASLHAEPEFRSWVPDSRAIEELLRNVGQKLSPGDTDDAKKVDEAIREEVKLATDRHFTPEQRAMLAKRMRDVAITVRARSGDDKARDVIRAAKAIEGAGLITSPPSDLEFLSTFIQKGIMLSAQRQGGQLRVPVANKPA